MSHNVPFAFNDEQTPEKAKEAEPYGYINKPFEETDLRQYLNEKTSPKC